MSDSENPYAQQDTPQLNPYAPAVISNPHAEMGSDSELTRRKYLSHEASVKSVGFLYILGGIFSFVAGAIVLFPAFAGRAGANELVFLLILSVVLLLISILQLVAAFGFRKLASWSKVPGGIVATIGLLSFPLGTLINAYVLYLLFSEKGRMVFSPEYKKVIQETPHIKYKTSIVIWILLGLLVAIVLFGAIGAVFVG